MSKFWIGVALFGALLAAINHNWAALGAYIAWASAEWELKDYKG